MLGCGLLADHAVADADADRPDDDRLCRARPFRPCHRLETATPTPLPTEPLIIRDSLTGSGDSLYVRDKPSTMADDHRTVSATDPPQLQSGAPTIIAGCR